MNGKIRHLLLTLALCALGVGLLLALTWSGTTDVQAEQSMEQPAEAQVEQVSAQAMYDLQPLFVDGYDGTYTSTYQIPRAITYTVGSAPYTWGRVLTSTTEFTDTLWCVRGEMGTSLDPDTDFYTDGVTTTVTYGPFSLKDAITVELEFSHWVSMSVGEIFEWGVSTNGSTYTYTTVTHVTPGDREMTSLSSVGTSELADILDQETVYLAFRFQSDDDGLTDRGVFLDDVQVRTTYDWKTYLPIFFQDWFEEYTYEEPFEPPFPSPAWPNGHYYRSVADSVNSGYALQQVAPYEFEQGDDFGIAAAIDFWYGYTQDDDDKSNVYYIGVIDNHDHVFLTGPAYVLGDNWEYQAYMRRATNKDPNLREYGLLLSPTEIDPRYPRGNNVLTFHIRNWTSETNGWWLVRKWTINASDDHPAATLREGKSSLISHSDHVWNILRIERKDDTLKFWIVDRADPDNTTKWTLAHQYTDPSLADMYYIGFFAANNEVTDRRDWQFDNVYVHAAP